MKLVVGQVIANKSTDIVLLGNEVCLRWDHVPIKPWSKQDDDLLSLKEEGIRQNEIGLKLGRTEIAIRNRFAYLRRAKRLLDRRLRREVVDVEA